MTLTAVEMTETKDAPLDLNRSEAATRGVLRNFVKFTGKHLCQSLFSNKVDRTPLVAASESPPSSL